MSSLPRAALACERDVTPEATERVVERIMPGFGEQMRAISLQYTPTAILSRQTAGFVAPVSFSIFQDGQNQFEKPLMKFGKRFHTVWI